MAHQQITSEEGLELLSKVRNYVSRYAEVKEHVDGFGHTSFRVNNKPFVMMGENEEGTTLSIKTDIPTQELLLQQGHFKKTPYIGQHGWVTLLSNDHADWQELHELLMEGYCRTAPKRLVKQYIKEVTH
ncbi:MmcQ/YjbR family DNA-binding protein [Paenibacillus thalictri]|uniref:MmcQ/YjbR family DNA-binding protein n=1 Tax=Paenibacillus thalictri TaxID=2527873 RepID=A0A4V2J446_9BACL|nr:MmcQ/YjbR family DNA-binding protein [Paenibacillus thalictri]TBL77829.1 MmcQ/YjbR family DNA-binding protein [Paenibacillus thalictri]